MISSELFILFIHLNIYEYGKMEMTRSPKMKTVICKVRLAPLCVV